MLKDRITFTIKSGKGGHGSLASNLKMAVGGDGGDGGDIYVRGNENVYDFSSLDEGGEYKAERGENGEKRRHTGNKGKDKTLAVPLITEIHIGNRVPFKIYKHGQKVKILEGGKGGTGSITVAKRHYAQLHGQKGFNPAQYGNDWDAKYAESNLVADDEHENYLGKDGKTQRITLLLKLYSDVIFIGYPNAGKSSLLNSLTNAHVKTASYAFTTLEPQIALLDGYRLMDLPGLIEGTYEGKGLGTSFVKHTESSRLVAHVISYENEDLMKIYKTLRKELKAIDPKLAAKPEMIILSKNEDIDPKVQAKSEKIFAKLGLPVVSVSIIDDESLEKLKTMLKSELEKLKAAQGESLGFQ